MNPQPIQILHERDHVFVPPTIKPKKGKGRCQKCNRAATNIAHLGAPRSLNVGGSGSNHWVYQEDKKQWQQQFRKLLESSELPLSLLSVHAEGMICFPDRKARDQGNFRYMIEKALGDALKEGGWIKDDCFYPQDMYQFGGLQATYQKGESWLRIMIFPRERKPNPFTDRVKQKHVRRKLKKRASKR